MSRQRNPVWPISILPANPEFKQITNRIRLCTKTTALCWMSRQRNPVKPPSRPLAFCPKLFLYHEHTYYFPVRETRDIRGDGNTLWLNGCPREGWKRHPFVSARTKDTVDSPARRDTPKSNNARINKPFQAFNQ